MAAAIRHMISRFEKLEAPFLANSARRRNERRKSHGDDVWSGEDIEFELGERPDWYDSEYKPCGFRERWRWIHTKNSVLTILSAVERLQIRRIAMQTNELILCVHARVPSNFQ
jgi:hypothetical protein